MKRDKRTIDEILRQYLPSAPQEEVASAGETVLLRLQEEMQDGIEKFKYPEPELNLRPYEQLALVAISLLRGQGDGVHVFDKADELAGRHVPAAPFIFALARLEKLGLIEKSGGGTPKKPQPELYGLTPRGKRALAAARVTLEEGLRGYLEDLI